MTIINYGEVIRELDFDYVLYQKYITELDSLAVKKHNEKHPPSSKFHLRTDLAPCPFEGDLKSAKVILLLANPHSDNTTIPKDHIPLNDGWGIWGMSKSASIGMYEWWRPRLRYFISNHNDENEWRNLSNKVASFQAVSWASEKFHEANSLPSKILMLQSLRYLMESDPKKIFIVMRQSRYWHQVLQSAEQAQIIHTKNPLCSHLSERNLRGEGSWKRLVSVLKE